MIWFGYSANLDRLANINVTIHLGQAVIHPSDCIRDLGVLLDSSLSTVADLGCKGAIGPPDARSRPLP